MRDYRLYLKDILSAMDSIEAFVEGMSFEEFGSDDKTSSAVIQKFEIIGEATKNIPDEIRQQNSTVPWKEMFPSVMSCLQCRIIYDTISS